MKVTYNEEQRFIVAEIVGLLDMEAVERGLVEMNTVMDRYKCHHVLYDLCQVELALEVHEIYFVPKLLKEAGNMNVKRAVLFSTENEQDFAFFETVAGNQGLNVQIFAERKPALDWLLA
ncbi:hypothetical protein [Pontiella agarivorans]|uniref:STAS/SEC14 domain-containing protein n=1 Tax=Pontiella agarivorans TaxID=3038953 RepID=A0ABU5MTX5_9BACT|nr:hypothetical protein [Pontiella agarivorans]MDZ8117679.1 hypothetical protein [Pontiella agarivorans]